jgi:quercetin dioxygenase-like cupin family protein
LKLACATAAALTGAGTAAGYVAGAASRPAPMTTREVLAQVVDPSGAAGRTLALSRVRIPARTALALHRHPGYQVAYVERGTLTYTVRRGHVKVFRGAADADPELVRTIGPNQTGQVRPAEWVVERPGDVHFGANRGERPVTILLATLFVNGRPAAIPVPDPPASTS